MDVKLMHRQGASVRRIARETGLSRVTVRRILAGTAPKPYGPRPPRPKKLDPFLGRLAELVEARPYARATGLHEAIGQEGYTGCDEAVKIWLRARRREARARRRAWVRFETAAGVEGQFDWKGPVKGLRLAEPETGVLFVRFLLAWSRARWTLAVRDQTLPSVLGALVWAFERIGASRTTWCSITPRRPSCGLGRSSSCIPCSPSSAATTGSSPRPPGRTTRNARARRRAPTRTSRPLVRLERERPPLLPLPGVAFDPRVPESRRGLADGTGRVAGAAYSVPFALVGSRVIVKADVFGDEVSIYAKAELVARPRRVAAGERAIVEAHVAALRRPRFERLRERAAAHARRLRPEAARAIVPWPAVEVEQWSIDAYVEAVGGRR